MPLEGAQSQHFQNLISSSDASLSFQFNETFSFDKLVKNGAAWVVLVKMAALFLFFLHPQLCYSVSVSVNERRVNVVINNRKSQHNNHHCCGKSEPLNSVF